MSLPYRPFVLVLWFLLSPGLSEGQRSDVEPEIELRDGVGPSSTAGAVAACSCSGSVVAAVIVTAIVFILLAGFWWYFKGRRTRLAKKPDTDALNKAAYDNPHFQGDDLDQTPEGQTRITIEPGAQTDAATQCTTTTIATNTTSTLERGKTTLERVMAAIIRGSRSDPSKKSKDDSYLVKKDVIVPLHSHDFAGLGFTVQGNLKEGLYVKEVLHRGPASQSGQVDQGDRVIALTILTEHVVFKDALTILSCASPYPVLLHLKKRKPLSGSFSSSSSKGKLSNHTVESSCSLVHPAFRSQSHGDLSKIDVDVSHLSMSNFLPPLGKSPGIAQKIPKSQYSRGDQRKTENRHSERAIDVPGVAIKSSSVAVDIDGFSDDKKELANVQVHRTMSSNVDAKNEISVELPEASIELPTFEDSKLTETTENLRNIQVKVDYSKPPSSKTKFGVKVFPDLTFVKGRKKVNENDEFIKDTKIDISEIDIPTIALQNEAAQNKENSEIEMIIGGNTSTPKKDLDLKLTSESSKDNQERDFRIDLPGINLPSLSLSVDKPKYSEPEIRLADDHTLQAKIDPTKAKKHEGDYEPGEIQLKMPELNVKGIEKSEGEEMSGINVEVHEPEISLPGLKVTSNSKSEKEDSDNDSNKKKSKFGFKMPDINLPSFSLKSSKKQSSLSGSDTEDESKHVQTNDITIKQSNINLPQVNTESEFEIPKKSISLQKEDTQEFKLDMPDISQPSLGFKGTLQAGYEEDENSQDVDNNRESEDFKQNENENKKTKYGFKFGIPDVSLPSFSSKFKNNDGNDKTEKEKEDQMDVEEDAKTKSEFEIKLDIPDINIPIRPRRNSKVDKASDDEMDKNEGFYITEPDITLHTKPEVVSASLDLDHDADIRSEVDVEHEQREKSKLKFSIPLPNIGLETGMSSKITDDSFSKMGIQESNATINVSMPDVSMPKFNLKGEYDGENFASSDNSGSKTNIQGNKGGKHFDINIPSINLEANLNDDFDYGSDDIESGIKIIDSSKSDDESTKKKSKHGFKIGVPEFSMPSFNIKGSKTSKASDDMSNTSEQEESRAQNLEITIPKIDVKTHSKCEETNDASVDKLNIKIPDVSLPSLSFEANKDIAVDTNADQVDLRNLGMSVSFQNQEELRMDLEKEATEEKKKSKHGFKLGMPDINVPSFSLKAGSKAGKDIPEGEAISEIDVDSIVSKTDVETQKNASVHLALNKPSLSLSADRVLEDTQGENDHKPIRRLFSEPEIEKKQNDKKKSKDKTGFNFKFKGPEFSFPNFGHKHEKYPKDSKQSAKVESSEHFADRDVDFKIKSSSSNDNKDSEFNYDIKIPSLPEASLKDKLNAKVSIDINEGTNENVININDLSTSRHANLNETLNYKIQKTEKSEASLNFKIPRVDLSHNIPSTLTSNEAVLNIKTHTELESESYEITGSDYSLPDEIKAEVSGRSDLEFSESKMKFSEIQLPIIMSSGIEHHNAEANSELSEDDMNDGLNVTDATKKKRFGIKINPPDASLPFHQSSQEDEENNQSDEMKTYQMKYKLPSAHIDLPSYEESLSTDSPPNMYVQLPRVKIANSKSKDYIEKDNLEVDNLGSEVDPSKFSLGRSLENECDEWKMKGGSGGIPTANVSLLREKFNTKLKDNEKLTGTKYKLDLDIKRGSMPDKYDFDIDEPDFLIPGLKSQPDYNSTFSPEGFEIPSLNSRENEALILDSSIRLPDYELNWKQTQEAISSTGSKSKPYALPFNNTSGSDVNVSLDSSSMENESDLPEVDSAYKKASKGFELDVPIPKLSMTKMNLEKSFTKDNDPSSIKSDYQNNVLGEKEIDNFGNAFGFRGFKNRMSSEDITQDNINFDTNFEGKFNNSRFTEVNSETALDLPEADYDLDYDTKSYPEFSDKKALYEGKSLSLPEGDQGLNFSIETKLKSLEESFNIKHSDIKGVEGHHINLGATVESSKQEGTIEQNKLKEILQKSKKEEDEEKSKSKMKLGLGFGFKGFNKSSDSDDNEVENKISKKPEGSKNENLEKVRSKPKKTFSFKGFGKSSSDTDDENLAKVSDHPMQKSLDTKQASKGVVITGSKSKSQRSSDSDDNIENEKVDLNPQAESNLKKSKIKSNLGFGFMNKSKVVDQESNSHVDASVENKKEQNSPDEDVKMKSKGKINLGLKGTKDAKYDTRSESEGGEDEKITMDSRGEENRGKSKYGIGFGFRKHGKNSSDSEGGDNDEQKVHLDERGSTEKSKESKSKSLKLGFKGFKNLKGKIQTEINKMRHESPSSDEDGHEAGKNFNEKRKKVTKKKEKDKKIKRDSEKYLDATEEATLASAAYAAKDNRRKKVDRKSASSSSSSSSDSSSDDEQKSVEQKKKKKSKLKRKDETKSSTSTDTKIDLSQSSKEADNDDITSSSHRSSDLSTGQAISEPHVTVVLSEPQQNQPEITSLSANRPHMEIQSDPRNYIVVREMKLKENITHETSINHNDIENRNLTEQHSQSYYQKQEHMMNDSENGFWGSDSDMEKGKIMDTDVNLSSTSVALKTSGAQRVLTDSEELKRKATSLGDLSRLHEGMLTGTLLERAVSLDLKNATVGPPALHIRRLQLPDSSATSIDEEDESALSSPKKLDKGGFLKSAGQWGTLEEAMNLRDKSNGQLKIETSVSSPVIYSQSTIVKTTSTDEGVSISNIEISGERGSSVTALSVKKSDWDDSFEDDEIPSLPSSPIPTTITVMEDDRTTDSNEFSGSDPNIVVVGSEPVQAINNLHNLNYHLHPSMTSNYDSHILSQHGRMSSSNTSVNSDSGTYSPRHVLPGDRDDSGGVTITMVPAESHLNAHNISNDNNISLLSKASKTLTCQPDLINYDALQQSSLITVSHDLMQENGEIITETTEHNVSDEYITPDSTPQKSMTQITLEGDGVSGYTVTEGTISRTVIISNPETSPVNIVQTENNDHSYT